MRQIQFLLVIICSGGLLVGCANMESPDNAAADSTSNVKCQKAMAQTGSMIAANNCNQDSNLITVERDPLNRMFEPRPASAQRTF